MNVFNFFLDEAIKICGWKIKLSVFSMGSCLTDYSCIMGLCLKKKKKTICFGARAWQAIIQRKYGAYWNIANYRSIT